MTGGPRLPTVSCVMWRLLVVLVLVPWTGCCFLPEIAHQPTLHNPFPQLSTVAVVPFFNQSTEPTVDGRQFALYVPWS